MDFLYFCAGGVFMLALLYFISLVLSPSPDNVMTINFEGPSREKLENLRVLTEKTTRTEVIACALATYHTLQLAIKEGKKVALIDDDSKLYQEVQLP